jgi:hypothetical protein
MPAPYQKDTLTLDAVSWTNVIPPFHCSSISVRSLSSTLSVRLLDSTGSNEDLIGPLGQEEVGAYNTSDKHRFLVGFVAFQLRALSGAPQVRLTYRT